MKYSVFQGCHKLKSITISGDITIKTNYKDLQIPRDFNTQNCYEAASLLWFLKGNPTDYDVVSAEHNPVLVNGEEVIERLIYTNKNGEKPKGRNNRRRR